MTPSSASFPSRQTLAREKLRAELRAELLLPQSRASRLRSAKSTGRAEKPGVRTDRIETTRMTAMANVRLVSGGQMEVPDDARLTDRGIEWLDDDGVHHVVPWTAVVEFIGPPPTPPTPMVEKM
jgi:hypothetical protein